MEVVKIKVYNPFPAGETNVYIINDELVVDAGVSDERVKQKLEEALRIRGMDFESATLVVTHPHADHFGSAYLFSKVFAHENACEKMFDAEKEYFRLVTSHFILEGMPEKLAREMQRRAEERYKRFAKPCECCNKISDKIKAGEDKFDVIHVPGHSFGHIALINSENIFSGDVLLEGITPNPVIEPVDEFERLPVLDHFIDTVKKLYLLRVKRVYPGHREFNRDIKDVLREYLRSFEERCYEVYDLCEDKTAFEIALKLFDINQIFLAMSEVIAYLDFLSERGFVEKSGRKYLRRGRRDDLKEVWREIREETIREE